MEDHGYGFVLFKLGATGMSWTKAHELLNEARDDAAKIHSMGARGMAAIPGTKVVLVYDIGTDGMDYKWSIENAPPPDVHVDWHMTPEEWEELRAALVKVVEVKGDGSPYLYKLYREGKIGAVSPAVTPFVNHAVKPLDAHENTFKCSCGETFVATHGFAVCPLSPGYQTYRKAIP
jgi:hypothetical protein